MEERTGDPGVIHPPGETEPGWSNDLAVGGDPDAGPLSASHPLENPEPPPEPGASNDRASRDGVLSQEELEARVPGERSFPPAVHIEPGESNARSVRAEEPAEG